MDLSSRVYYMSANLVIKEDLEYDIVLLLTHEGCVDSELQEALKYCEMEIIGNLSNGYILRRTNNAGSEGNQHGPDNSRPSSRDIDKVQGPMESTNGRPVL